MLTDSSRRCQMRWFVVLAIVIVGVVTAPRLFAQTSRPPAEVTDPIEALRAGYLLVRGEGGPHPDAQQWQRQPQAIRAAQVVAYRELLEITKGVAIYASTNVNDLMLASDAINARVQGTVQGA